MSRFGDRVGQRSTGPRQLGFGWLARRLARQLGPLPIRIALWDGTELALDDGPWKARLVFHDRRALVETLLSPERRVGEAYRAGRLEVEGDLPWLLAEAYRARTSRIGGGLWSRWAHLNTRRASRANVHRHYDLGNEFYRLWLDEQLLYTCAFFPDPSTSLEEAQLAKMDRICTKLWLRPGDRVVEAGCGWGSLALHMARHYGVRVRAYNISAEQVRYARRRALNEGLAGCVEFVQDDYRAIRGTYDVFVSVGMLEHVGRTAFRALADVIDRSLPPERGRGLLHFIGRDRPRSLNAWTRRRIFPGAYPPTLDEAIRGVIRPARSSVLDVENLRLHYARTLEHWLARFDRRESRVRELFDERFARTWRFYLAGSQAAFAVGSLQLFQVTFARSGDPDIPWSRDSRTAKSRWNAATP